MSNPPEEGITNREHSLTAAIEKLLPDFARTCRETTEMVILHQDSARAGGAFRREWRSPL